MHSLTYCGELGQHPTRYQIHDHRPRFLQNNQDSCKKWQSVHEYCKAKKEERSVSTKTDECFRRQNKPLESRRGLILDADDTKMCSLYKLERA